ncbi:hypothetical protein LguiB_011116 [Lonicera macranthoides]
MAAPHEEDHAFHQSIPNTITATKRRRLTKRFSNEEFYESVTTTTLKMVAGSFYIPKKNPLKPLGEDAHFISPRHQTLGVADRVGGWARRGIDAGEYARELMNNCVYALKFRQPKNKPVDPKNILNEAYLNTESEGSSTACVLTLTEEYLHAVNVGDSGFVVIREGNIIYQSGLHQRGFNCPYQLGNTSGDSPINSGEEMKVAVEAGDVVVVGSDGLFDNVYSNEIEDVVGLSLKYMKEEEEEEEEEDDEDSNGMIRVLAWSLAKFALMRALDENVVGPFEKAALRAGFEHTGGKYDDITYCHCCLYFTS